jgi:protein involved in polysaccharide export with SLBB domain
MQIRTQVQTLHVNLGQEMAGKISTKLHPLDEIRIFSLNELQIQPHIDISGEVVRPGSVELQKNTRIRDILVKAQLKDSAHLLSGELSRQTTAGVNTLRFSVGKALSGEDEHNLFLQHLDSITVFKDPRLAKQGSISIGGQIVYPGEYKFNTGAKLSEILLRAGGLSDGAFLMGAKLYRKNLAQRQREIRDSFVAREQENLNNLKIKASQMSGEDSVQDQKATLESLSQVDETLEKLSSIEIEGRLALDFRGLNTIEDIKNSINDVVLEDGDRFEIPTQPSEVTIAGQVYAPSTILHREGLTVRDYIQAAGGFNDNAYTTKVFILKASGQAIPVNQLRNRSLRYVEPVRSQEGNQSLAIAQLIEAGDTIIVPTRIQIRRNQFKESLDSIYKMAVTLGALGSIF